MLGVRGGNSPLRFAVLARYSVVDVELYDRVWHRDPARWRPGDRNGRECAESRLKRRSERRAQENVVSVHIE